MVMSPHIRVDDDVYEFLKKSAEPFVDTPNAVLRRLLGLDAQPESMNGSTCVTDDTQPIAAKNPSRAAAPARGHGARSNRRSISRRRAPKAPRVAPGLLIPQEDYVVPILQSLVERGGNAAAKDVIDAVGQKLQNRLSEVDKSQNASGQIRWQNRAQFVRLNLVESGFLARNGERGIWTITDSGRAHLAQQSKKG